MPEYKSPGIYIQETASGATPIQGHSTSTAGFLGQSERGPEAPQFITNYGEYQRLFGGYVPDKSYLAYAVQGFFDNGGQRCFVGRITANGAAYAILNHDIGLSFCATGRGAWGNDIYIGISKASQANRADTDDFRSIWVRVKVHYGGSQPENLVEDYDNLSLLGDDTNNVVQRINSSSNFIRVCWQRDTAVPENLSGKLDATLPRQLAGGKNGQSISPEDYDGSPNFNAGPVGANFSAENGLFGQGTGYAALADIQEISLLIVPDEVQEGMEQLTHKSIQQCETLKDRFAIVSAKHEAGKPENLVPPKDTSYGAFYYPWIQVYDTSINDSRLVPPGGHIAGIYARSDIERGVWKAPANEVVVGAVDLQLPVTKAVQDLLNPRGVNCLRDFRADGRGIRVWGARTMSSDPEWKYINVRRLFINLETSIDEGTQWVVFEPNNDTTWSRMVLVISEFLTTVWRNGGLMGNTADEAFFVRCDRTTMTQNDIDNGRLTCFIGVAPIRPAEFIILRISQKTADSAGG